MSHDSRGLLRTRRNASWRKDKTLDDLFHDTLKDIYYAERKILKALPKMKRAAAVRAAQGSFRKAPLGDRRPDRAPASRCSSLWGKPAARQDLRLPSKVIIAEGEEING